MATPGGLRHLLRASTSPAMAGDSLDGSQRNPWVRFLLGAQGWSFRDKVMK